MIARTMKGNWRSADEEGNSKLCPGAWFVRFAFDLGSATAPEEQPVCSRTIQNEPGSRGAS